MGTRVKASPEGYNAHATERTEYQDTSFDQRESTVDGYTFHFGPNMVINFLDEGVGAAHAARLDDDSDGITEDSVPFGSSRF